MSFIAKESSSESHITFISCVFLYLFLNLNHFCLFLTFMTLTILKITDHSFCQMSLTVGLSDVSSSLYLNYALAGICDARLFSLHPIRWYTTSICHMTGHIRFITWLRWGKRQNFRLVLLPWPGVLLLWLCYVIPRRGVIWMDPITLVL